MDLSRVTLFTVSLALALPSSLAYADVTFDRLIKVKAAGAVSNMSSETRIRTQISGDRSRTEVIPADEMAAELAGPDVRIVRLDRQSVYDFIPNAQAYRETSIESLAEKFAGLKAEVNESAGGQALPIATDDCEWSEARFSSKATREKERIAGQRATRHILSMKQSCTDEANDQSCDLEWIMEPWMASRLSGYAEASGFYEAYAGDLGMDYLVPQMPGESQMLLALFPNRWESLLDEMESFDGYPLRTVLTLKIGGKACMTSAGEPLAEDSMWTEARDRAHNSAVDRAGAETSSAAGSAAGDAMGDGIGGSIGGAAVGAATGSIIGGISGMFKKDTSKKSSSQQSRKVSQDAVTVFRISTEITDWNTKSISPSRYEPPEGWTQE